MKAVTLFALFLLLAACGKHAQEMQTTVSEVELLPGDTLTLAIDASTSLLADIKYYDDPQSGKGYFVCRDNQTMRLLFYDETTLQESFVTRFTREDPNGIGKMCDFHIHTLDSIFFTNSPKRFVLADTSGKVKRVYHLFNANSADGLPVTVYCNVGNTNAVPVKAQDLYFFRWPDGVSKIGGY